MNGRMAPGDFHDYLEVLGRLLHLRTSRRAAIEDELRAHMEERFSALTSEGLEPERAMSMALAEFGDAAALAAEFSAISRLQKRRWMMRFTVGSIAATLVLSAALVCMWPAGPGEMVGSMAHAQVLVEDAEPAVPAQAMPEEEANALALEKLNQLVTIQCPSDTPMVDALGFLSNSCGVQTHIDILELEAMQISPRDVVEINLRGVPAEMVLRLILAQYGLVYRLDNGVVIATTPEAMARELEIRVHKIGDLVEPSDDESAYAGAVAAPRDYLAELTELITSTVHPASWDKMGGPGTIGEYRGTLVVSQTAETHVKVEQLLDGLRSAMAE